MSKCKTCLLCSPNTIDRHKRKGEFKGTLHCNQGLVCSICNSFACNVCLRLILANMKKKKFDKWAVFVSNYLTNYLTNEGGSSDPFIGHCCELTHGYPSVKEQIRDHHILCESPMKYDGYFFVPQFNGLFSSPIMNPLDGSKGCVDIHCLTACGCDKNCCEAGVYHSVVSPKAAKEYGSKKIEGRLWNDMGVTTLIVKAPCPHDPSKIKEVRI